MLRKNSGNLFALIILSLFFLTGCSGESQPINFSHKKHTDQGIECIICHQFYEERTNSGNPTREVCSNCHSEPITDSPEEKKLIKNFLTSKREIPWKRVYYVPEHVYYTHFRHVVMAEIQCEFCHGKIAEQNKPLRKPLKKITMYFCINCHEKKNISNDCITCHK